MTPMLTHLVVTSIEADRRRADRWRSADLWDPGASDPPATPPILARFLAPLATLRTTRAARGARL
jgi:hypothetical protein